MYRKVAFTFLVCFFVYLQTATSLKCYRCQGQVDSDCHKFDNGSNKQEEKASECTQEACVMTISNKTDGSQSVDRLCEPSDYCNGPRANVTYCGTCFTNFCSPKTGNGNIKDVSLCILVVSVFAHLMPHRR